MCVFFSTFASKRGWAVNATTWLSVQSPPRLALQWHFGIGSGLSIAFYTYIHMHIHMYYFLYIYIYVYLLYE